MKRINYKKGFDVLLRSSALWKDRTDKEKKEIFETLNKEAGFNYYLEDYKTEEIKQENTLRNQIINLIKEADKREESININDLKNKIIFGVNSPEEFFQEEINRLLEDGIIFEPKVNFLRWLG